MLTIDEVCGLIINQYYKQTNIKQQVMSRQKMPCTRCGTHISPTWRPGPCGTSSLCNKCGLLYMVRSHRPRMIDLVVSHGRPVWMERQTDSLQWMESDVADTKDPRIHKWLTHEEERIEFVESKKRKFVEM
jgi:late competence protein required for DNA uptake (superfamily II DNA/RNA helicase)